MPVQITVIGAGVAGLAAAIALHRSGHEVTVLEQRTDISSGAGISICPSISACCEQKRLPRSK